MNQLIWFRNDLRISDHEPLYRAIELAKKQNSQCFAIYYFSEKQLSSQGAGSAKFSAISTALNDLNSSLAKLGVSLFVVNTKKWLEIAENLSEFCKVNEVSTVHAHFEPGLDEYQRDKAVASTLKPFASLKRYNDIFLAHPAQHLNKQGNFFKVFTPFKKSLLAQMEPNTFKPIAAPDFKEAIKPLKFSLSNSGNWTNPYNLAVTESQALSRVADLVSINKNYAQERDFPNQDGTSKLSVALSLGTITSRQIANELTSHTQSLAGSTYFSEIIWREFYKYLLYHRPEISKGLAFNTKWDAFPWRNDSKQLQRWKDGKTGVPIVDAAMRQLAQTGWMHNRLRMVTAMYLVKIMQHNWRAGEHYFANQLADFDFAANNGGWQWVASTGVDAVPYFRIFNPHQQSRRFDPKGEFVRKFLPEIADLPAKSLHEPAAEDIEHTTYPTPVVSYKLSRSDTLQKFKTL